MLTNAITGKLGVPFTGISTPSIVATMSGELLCDTLEEVKILLVKPNSYSSRSPTSSILFERCNLHPNAKSLRPFRTLRGLHRIREERIANAKRSASQVA